jgi:hypothetical protein
MGALITGVVLGVWLMASPAVLGYDGAARVSSIIAGVLAATMSWVALSEVTRPVRRLNVATGAWLVISALVLPQPLMAAINAAAVGALLAILGARPSKTEGRYGGGWSSLHA